MTIIKLDHHTKVILKKSEYEDTVWSIEFWDDKQSRKKSWEDIIELAKEELTQS